MLFVGVFIISETSIACYQPIIVSLEPRQNLNIYPDWKACLWLKLDRINLKLIWGRLRDFQARSLERQSLFFYREFSLIFNIPFDAIHSIANNCSIETKGWAGSLVSLSSLEETPEVLSWPETFWIILRVCGIFVQISETRPAILDFSCSSNWPKPCYNLDCLNYVLLERIWKGKYFFWIRRSS